MKQHQIITPPIEELVGTISAVTHPRSREHSTEYKVMVREDGRVLAAVSTFSWNFDRNRRPEDPDVNVNGPYFHTMEALQSRIESLANEQKPHDRADIALERMRLLSTMPTSALAAVYG